MGQRLYPLMRERPPGFRVNPNSPLYRDLKIAPYDPAIGRWWQDMPTRLGGEWWYYRGVWYPGYTPYVRWNPSWRRHVSFGSPTFQSGLRIIPPPSFLLPIEEFSIFWMFASKYEGDLFATPFGIFDSAVNTKLRVGIDSNWPYATLNGVTIVGHWAHQTVVVRYRPGTNQFQFWGNGVLYSQGTATLPSWSDTDILYYWATQNDLYTNQGFVADLMYWTRYLTDNEIAALSDINNVDFRLSRDGPPLLLPPARKFFPVAVAESATTAKIPWHLFFMSM